jgi:nitrogen regulatory protein P-II 2
MKLIIAMIQPERLPAVKKALFDAKVYKMTVNNALGAGQQAGYSETYRGVRHEIQLLKKVRLEVAVNDDFVDITVDAIVNGARTNNIGDGKILILNLEECIRIRTGERGSEAIG